MNFILKTKKYLIVVFSLFAIFGIAFLLFPAKAHAIDIEPVYSVLKNTDPNTTGGQIAIIWKQIITIINYLVIAILIFVAFAQILRINVNTYGLKKILPALLLAIIAANFSFLFCRLLVDLANITMSLFITQSQSDQLHGVFSGSGWADPSKFSLKEGTVGTILWFLVAQVFVFVGSALVLVLAYLFFIRIWMIYFLVALSPLAFMATVLPATKSVFNMWWTNFAKWVFLPVISIFWLWLGNQWMGNVTKSNDYMMSYVFAGVCYYLAITTPFKMGGVVMTAWANLGKGLYKNKATGWAWNKTKTKWVDPWVDDLKTRANNWYLSRASGRPSVFLNPLGAIARRGIRVTDDRAWRKKKTEGLLNQGYREAFGGKLGKDGDKYWSHEKQTKRGEWLDDIDSLFGEKEWKELDLREKYFRTDKGKEATLRTAQYGYRMEGTQQIIDNEKRIARVKAMSGSEEYMNDEHYKKMIEKRNTAKAESFALEMAEGKLEGDLFQEVEGNAYLLDMSLEGVRTFQKKLEELKKRQAEAQTDDEKRIIGAQLRAVEGELSHSNTSYNERMRIFYNQYYDKEKKQFKGLSYVLRKMVTDDQGKLLGVKTDTNGNFVSADPSEARSFSEVMGFDFDTAKKAYRYHTGRRTKQFSLIVDKEKASVLNKREDTDAAYEIENNPREREALPYILVGDTANFDEFPIRKGSSEVYCMLQKGMNSISNDKYAKNAETFSRWIREDSIGKMDETANKLRRILANNCESYFKRVINNPQNQTVIRQKAAVKFSKDIEGAIAKKEQDLGEKLSNEQRKLFKEQFIADDLSRRKDYQDEMEKYAKETVSVEGLHLSGTEIEGDWNDDVSFKYDTRSGGFIPKVNDTVSSETEATKKSLFLESLSNTINLGPTRGVWAEGKNSWNGTFKEQIPIAKRQAGKNEEENLKYERVDQLLNEAAQGEMNKIISEKGSVDARQEFIKPPRQEGEIDID